MQPTKERFHPCDLPGLKINFWLLVQQEFLPPQRAPQIGFERLTLRKSHMHGVLEN